MREDATLAHVLRPYKDGDLSSLLTLYEECELHHISADINLGIMNGNSLVPLLSNFEVKKDGIAALLNAVSESDRKTIKYFLANAKSAHGRARIVAEQIEKILKSWCHLAWAVSVILKKYTLESYFRAQDPDMCASYYFWIRSDLFKDYLEHNLQSFLKTLYNGDFPIIVLLDSPNVCNLKFCAIGREPPSSLAIDMTKHSQLKHFVHSILERNIATPFVLALTFSSEEPDCRATIRSFIPDHKLDGQPLRLDESQLIDWKLKFNSGSLAEDAAAFGNACGGLLIYGIDNSGRVVGCGNITLDEISNTLQVIRPPLKCEIVEVFSDRSRLLGLLVWPPDGNVVYRVSKGRRPFRYMSSTRDFDYDDEVVKERHRLCQ